MHLRLASTLLAALWTLSGVAKAVTGAAEQGAPPNVLVIVADDLGVEALSAYGEGSDTPITPTLDLMAQNGLLFRNAWSNPKCSPTRATMLTGRYSFRTGIGDVVYEYTSGLPLSEVTIPELLDLAASGYAHALIGKWHLGQDEASGATFAPNLAGFSYFDGTLRGTLGEAPGLNYYNWPRTTNGVSTLDQTYNTTALVDSALSWIDGQSGPWFCMLSFHAPHAPMHAPPAGLFSEDLTGLSPATTPRPFFKAMIEAMDAEIGRLIASLGPEVANTMILFIGDNGTPENVVSEPYMQSRAKNTLYEGGVNVPLIAWGPLVTQPGSECDALVNLSDVFATVAGIAGVDASATLPEIVLDSVSFGPYFANPALPSLRSFAYTEYFEPIGALGLAPEEAERTVRDDRYKLILKLAQLATDDELVGGRLARQPIRPAVFGQHVHEQGNLSGRVRLGWELYDLALDPFEQVNLLSGVRLKQPQRAALASLLSQFHSLF